MADTRATKLEEKETSPCASLKSLISEYFQLCQSKALIDKELFNTLDQELKSCDNLDALKNFIANLKARDGSYPRWVTHSMRGAFALLIEKEKETMAFLMLTCDLKALERLPYSPIKVLISSLFIKLCEIFEIKEDTSRLKKIIDQNGVDAKKVVETKEEKVTIHQSVLGKRARASELGKFAPALKQEESKRAPEQKSAENAQEQAEESSCLKKQKLT